MTIKQFYNSSDERFLKEQAMIMFKELSDGIYLVVKDRVGKFMECASTQTVLQELNGREKIVVVSKGGGNGYANWNFDSFDERLRKMKTGERIV